MARSSSLKTAWDPKATPYPPARRSDTVETFTSPTKGAVQVANPYDWMHDPENGETVEFVARQAEFTGKYLEQFKYKDRFRKELEKAWNYPRFSCPSKQGDGHYYFSYNSGLQAQSSIYRFKAELADALPKEGDVGGTLFFDANLLSKDGTVSRSTSSFSDDGRHWAYAISRSGSDWTNVFVRETSSPHKPDMEVGKDEGRLEDVLRYVKFSSIGWTKDTKNPSFFYQRFPEKKEHGGVEDDKAGTGTEKDSGAMIYLHRVGTKQEDDLLIHKDDAHPEFMFGAGTTDDGRFVVLSTSKDTGRNNLLWIADLEESSIEQGLKWHKVVNEWGHFYADVANDGTNFTFYTNRDGADKYKIVSYDLAAPEKGFVDLVPHNPDMLLDSFHVAAKDKLVLQYSVDVREELHLHELGTGKKIGRIGENLLGSIGQIAGKSEDSEFWFSMESYTSPTTIYRYRFDVPAADALSTYRATTVTGIDPSEFVTEQVYYPSKDGTSVSLWITRPKSVAVDGTAPVLLYSYGGFSISLPPGFRPAWLTWAKSFGGILAVPNIRGGGERGEEWHLAGTKERKQNVFDDFQYAAKFLIANQYAHPERITINGGSNGGLLVAACANQAPELFGCAIAEVGVMDMLRFQRQTVGGFWVSDYGNADEDGFDYLIAYSPLENVPADKKLPPMLIMTSDHDDRVSPLHSLKLAAQIQHTQPDNPNPLLLRVDIKAGHGAGKPISKQIDDQVAKLGFISQTLGLEWVA